MVQCKSNIFLLSRTKGKIRVAFTRGCGVVVGMTSFCLFDATVFTFVPKRILKAQRIPLTPPPPHPPLQSVHENNMYILLVLTEGLIAHVSSEYRLVLFYLEETLKIINSYATFIGIFLYKAVLVNSKYINLQYMS